MSELVTDRNDPRLGYGIDEEKIPQHEAYLILSEEERAKGFVRKVRESYVHVGRNYKKEYGKNQPRLLTEEEAERYKDSGYFAYVEYDDELKASGKVGGCGTRTTMSLGLAETYARDPKFYGATYCCGCQKHLAVNEFVWDGTDEEVGS